MHLQLFAKKKRKNQGYGKYGMPDELKKAQPEPEPELEPEQPPSLRRRCRRSTSTSAGSRPWARRSCGRHRVQLTRESAIGAIAGLTAQVLERSVLSCSRYMHQYMYLGTYRDYRVTVTRPSPPSVRSSARPSPPPAQHPPPPPPLA